MSVNTDRIQYLFRRYLQKTCTREELQELFDCIARPENRALMEQLMDAEYEVLQPMAAAGETDWEDLFQQIVNKTDGNVYPFENKRRLPWVRIAAAAVIVLAVGIAGYWWLNRSAKETMAANGQGVQSKEQDVQPGGNKAVLTLADGSTIILDSAQNGLLTKQGNADVIKNKNGEVTYTSTGREQAAIAWNTLATPKGGQYQLVLPDGSKVWLNAASSIRYPVAFTGRERNVELTGEAYFEVAKDPARPFHVRSPAQDVEVLGTHFNINAYNDEEVVKTTLLEGSVKVSRQRAAGSGKALDDRSAILKPGEQAINNCRLPIADCRLSIDRSPDLELAMAWKNGLTAFKSADLKSIMRQVARWYNVEVVYEGNISPRSFTGGISRTAPLSELLHVLEVSKVHFRIEGSRLVVSP